MSFRNPDSRWLPQHVAVVGAERLARGGGATHAHRYPATGELTRELVLGGSAEVEAAVAAARAAWPAWRALGADKRRDLLLKLAALLEQRVEEFSRLLSAENGWPSFAGPAMVSIQVQAYRYFAGWADKLRGETIATFNGPSHDYVSYEPYGVIGAIVPWNGPLHAATMVLPPALAAGNCVVLKAPELAPYSVLRLGELCLEAGLPPGVVNVIAGGADVGEAMVRHRGIDKIQFVGSGATAKKVLAAAADTLKPCGLELGGKSAVLVFADADLQAAARRGLAGAVSASGQGCVNGTRLLVERAIYEPYLKMLAALAPHIKVGDPFDKTTIMGPLISEAALQRVAGVIAQAQNDGARLVCGGERLGGEHARGYFLPITVLADVDPHSALARHEVFGPVLAVTPFDGEDEAIALANDSDYGLGAYIHTENLRRAHHVAAQMQAGMVQVNASGEGMQPNVPFGGYKQSGYGRLGGEHALREFQQVKNVWVNLARPQPAQAAK